jgi:hypothetical protein
MVRVLRLQRATYMAARALARSAKKGVWANAAVAPWVHRNGVEAKVHASCPHGDEASDVWGALS